MERRINKKLEAYFHEFKENVRQKAMQTGTASEDAQILLQYIVDYDRVVLVKDDFQKRKRVKNVVHLSDRCCAKRANGEQCTRRKKDETSEFCGTHLKGTPHGICDSDEDTKPLGHKVEVWAQDIQGIVYYIDNKSNVYQVEDIMQHNPNPKIIAKYIKVGETYFIPEFNI